MIHQQEMARLQSKLSGLRPDEMAAIEKAISTVVRKMLNDPILFLKEGALKKKWSRACRAFTSGVSSGRKRYLR